MRVHILTYSSPIIFTSYTHPLASSLYFHLSSVLLCKELYKQIMNVQNPSWPQYKYSTFPVVMSFFSVPDWEKPIFYFRQMDFCNREVIFHSGNPSCFSTILSHLQTEQEEKMRENCIFLCWTPSHTLQFPLIFIYMWILYERDTVLSSFWETDESLTEWA